MAIPLTSLEKGDQNLLLRGVSPKPEATASDGKGKHGKVKSASILVVPGSEP